MKGISRRAFGLGLGASALAGSWLRGLEGVARAAGGSTAKRLVVFFSPNVRGPYAEDGANDEQGAGAELCAKLRVLLRSPPIWAIVAANSLRVETGQQTAANRVEGMLTAFQDKGVTTPESRRDGLWNEFRRKLGISGDRLWAFVRLLSGAVGGDVNEIITMADESTMRATKAIQDQRVTIAKRVSDMQSKIVETVVGSMAKDSKLTLDKNGTNQLVVVDGAPTWNRVEGTRLILSDHAQARPMEGELRI